MRFIVLKRNKLDLKHKNAFLHIDQKLLICKFSPNLPGFFGLNRLPPPPAIDQIKLKTHITTIDALFEERRAFLFRFFKNFRSFSLRINIVTRHQGISRGNNEF